MIREALPQLSENVNSEITLIAQPQGGGVSATIALRWCICPSLFEKLKQDINKKPYLLVVVTENDEETTKKLIPLDQALEFISFSQSGKSIIRATIARLDDQDAHKVRRAIKRGHTILDKYDNFVKTLYSTDISSVGSGEVSIHVAPEFFAERPKEWVWRWANYLHEGKPKNQCEFRRRCMLAFTLKPFLVFIMLILWTVLGSITASILRFGFGLRGIDFSPIFHPFSYQFEDIWMSCKNSKAKSIFFTTPEGESQPMGTWLFMPVIIVPLFFINWLIFQDMEKKNIALITFLIPTACLLGTYALWILSILAEKLIPHSLAQWYEKNAKEAKRKLELAPIKEFEDRYDDIVCRGIPMQADLMHLPKQKRTLRLRYLDLKAKVCKPFNQ